MTWGLALFIGYAISVLPVMKLYWHFDSPHDWWSRDIDTMLAMMFGFMWPMLLPVFVLVWVIGCIGVVLQRFIEWGE